MADFSFLGSIPERIGDFFRGTTRDTGVFADLIREETKPPFIPTPVPTPTMPAQMQGEESKILGNLRKQLGVGKEKREGETKGKGDTMTIQKNLPTGEKVTIKVDIPSPAPQEGVFGRVSHYLPTGDLTSTGTVPQEGRTAAISRDLSDLIPMGSLVRLPDGRVFRIEDLTHKRMTNTLDIFGPEAATGSGLLRNVPYELMGRDLSGLRYNF